MIKEAVEAHFQATLAWEKKTKRDRKRAAKGKEKATEDDAEGSSASDSHSEGDEDEAMRTKDPAKEKNAGIRKVRLGTFEDSGKCKGWAFIDFLTSQQATAALVNGKNHYLNGRALTLEFASADAVRRGGGRMDGAASISAPAKDGKRSFDKRRQRSDAAENEAEEAVEGEEEEHQPIEQAFYRPPLQTNPYAASEASRAAAAIIQAGGKLHKPNKAERKALRDQKAKEDRSSLKRRVKPGAALADAKRENMAILPAAGKKVVFDD
jgi:RNA recognition motif-containing protein